MPTPRSVKPLNRLTGMNVRCLEDAKVTRWYSGSRAANNASERVSKQWSVSYPVRIADFRGLVAYWLFECKSDFASGTVGGRIEWESIVHLVPVGRRRDPSRGRRRSVESHS